MTECNLISDVAVRPGLIAVTPAMRGSMVSPAGVHVNGTGECISLNLPSCSSSLDSFVLITTWHSLV